MIVTYKKTNDNTIMKKIILTLLAAIAALSVDAQIIEVYKIGESTPWEIYGTDVKVKFRAKKITDATGITGSYARNRVDGVDTQETGKTVDQDWVQLWPGGPKFATQLVTYKKTTQQNSEENSTSTNLFDYFAAGDPVKDNDKWGDNWRTPTLGELETMISKCTISYNKNDQSKIISITIKQVNGSSGITIPTIAIQNTMYHGAFWTSKIVTDAGTTPITKRFALTLDFTEGGALRDYNIIPAGKDDGAAYCILAVLDE